MINEKILIAVDGSEECNLAFRWLCQISKRTKSQVVATYVNVIPFSQRLNAEIPSNNSGERILNIIEAIAKEEKTKVQTIIVQGRSVGPALTIEAKNIKADIIVLASKKISSNSNPLGKTSVYVLRHAQCGTLLWNKNKTSRAV
jgi:nucleotide-binding universal stress UspA family protein